jgi:hypothetical protein
VPLAEEATSRTGTQVFSAAFGHLSLARGIRPLRTNPRRRLGLGCVVDERGEEPGEALRGRDDKRAEERLVP